jgi:hypothetical protein
VGATDVKSERVLARERRATVRTREGPRTRVDPPVSNGVGLPRARVRALRTEVESLPFFAVTDPDGSVHVGNRALRRDRKKEQ